jgi:hypothetical protein
VCQSGMGIPPGCLFSMGGGGQGPKCKWLIEEITKRVTADLPMAAHASRATELRQNMSLTLAREVARQLSLRCRVVDCH